MRNYTRVPTNSKEWELYQVPGVGKASVELTRALRAFLRLSLETSSNDDFKFAWRHFTEVQNLWSHFGASDTEPRNIALDLIEEKYGSRVLSLLGY